MVAARTQPRFGAESIREARWLTPWAAQLRYRDAWRPKALTPAEG
jgi:hypothetical protein